MTYNTTVTSLAEEHYKKAMLLVDRICIFSNDFKLPIQSILSHSRGSG